MNSFPFRVGNIECIAIKDGDTTYRAADYVVNGPPEQVQRALATHGDEPDNIPSPYSGLLVRTESHLVLIDTGAGRPDADRGQAARQPPRRGGRASGDRHGHPDPRPAGSHRRQRRRRR